MECQYAKKHCNQLRISRHEWTGNEVALKAQVYGLVWNGLQVCVDRVQYCSWITEGGEMHISENTYFLD